jgi:putative ABC transport system permease protein
VANVAGLLLARHTARHLEVGVRRALGATSWRLVREGLAESAWLCAAGVIAGVLGAWAGVGLLRATAADALPRADAMAVDGLALGVAVAIASLVTLVVGLVPALAASGATARLHGAERGTTAAPRARLALGSITVAQLAISVVLLVSASLLGRSLVSLLRTDMGIVPDRVATASINLAMGRTLTSAQQADLVARIVDRIAGSPGVVAAGAGTSRPPDVSRMRLTMTRPGQASVRASYQAAAVPVTPGYFQALGIQLQRGRLFTGADHAQAPPVVILSASTARRLFPDRDPVGERIGLPVARDGTNTTEEMTVVGVTADVKFNGLDQQADDVVYRPFAQQPWLSAFVVARTGGDADALAARLARDVAAVDPAIAVSDARSMDAVLAAVTVEPRLRSLALAGVSLLALLVAGVGLHGVIAYSVSQRRAELGVRMALGADGPRIRRMVVAEGLALAVAGVAIGVLGAFGAARLLAGFLYGVAATDAASFAIAAAGALIAGVAASYVPARRASLTDPAVVLRGE